MTEVDPLLVVGVIAMGSLGWWFRFRWARERMRVIARALGLEFCWSFAGGPEIIGRRETFWVRIGWFRGRFTCVVAGEGRIPDDITLAARTIWNRLNDDIHTGDDIFDYRTNITGCTGVALALLDHETRELVLSEVVVGGATVHSGGVYREGKKPESLGAAVPGLTELAKRLVLRDDEIPTRLATNATSDKNPAVRLTILHFLIKDDRGAAVATAACNQALTDPSPELRLEAAIFLGDDGIETLMAIASETTVDQEMRIRAIRALARPFWTLRSLPLLESLLGEEQPSAVRRIAIAGIGSILRGAWHRPAPGTLQRLIELVADADNPTAENLARTIGQIGDPAGEPGLLQLLTHKDDKVKRTAAFSLGIVGTAESVAPLLRIGKGRNPWIKHAVARIQARLVGAKKGQLSISVPGDSSGGLSIAKDDETGGELSLAEKGEAGAWVDDPQS